MRRGGFEVTEEGFDLVWESLMWICIEGAESAR